MLANLKKGLTVALAATLCFATVSASAATWKKVDYNTSDFTATSGVLTVPVVYQEYDVNGYPTGRMVEGDAAVKEGLDGWANITVGSTWVSDVYPNAQYAKVYADGVYTGKVLPTGLAGEDAGVEYRTVDFMWEVAAPYRIYAETQAKLFKDGTVQWFFDDDKNYPVVYSGKNAAVVNERAYYGFANYHVVGDNKVDFLPNHIIEGGYYEPSVFSAIQGIDAEYLMAKSVTVDKKDYCDCIVRGVDADGRRYVEGYIQGAWQKWYGDDLDNLDWLKTLCTCEHAADCTCDACTYKKSIWPAAYNPYRYEVAYDAEIKIPRTFEHVLVGPSFDADGKQTAGGLKINATEYKSWVAPNKYDYAPAHFGIKNLISTENARVSNLVNSVSEDYVYCDITWTAGGFEATEPHALLEYLTVDGVVMDGSLIKTAKVYANDGVYYEEIFKPCIFRYTGAKANVTHRTVVDSIENDELIVRTEAYVNDTWVECARSYTGQTVNHETRYITTTDGMKSAVDVYVFSYEGVRYEMYKAYDFVKVGFNYAWVETWHVNDWDVTRDGIRYEATDLETYVPEA